MEGLHAARSLLRKGDYMMKLDLKDAYYAVPIHPESRKYLRFQFKGTIYEFCCLPFGLSLAPRVFTRILRPIVAKLRSEGIRTVIYLDDLLLIHHQKDTLSKIFLYVRSLLSSLGFIVKLEKCSPEPTCCLVFLGAVLDTTCMSVSLPEEQINRIQGACQEMLESQSTSLGGLSSLLGRMSHAARTGLWIAPLYYRALQRQQALLLHQFGWRPRCPISLSQPSLEDLRWWVSSAPHDRNSQDITPPPFDLSIRTDASLLGWGATCNGMTTGGRWSMEEAEQHINCLELKAAILALKAFLKAGMPPPSQCQGNQAPRHILLEMDNTTAVAYVNRRGGHSVTISVPTGLGTVVLPADLRVMADSPSLTGSVECGSRRSFEGIQHAHRVDASEGCLSGHSTSLLCSGDRPVCVAFEPSAASLCVATSRPRCLSGGRLSTGLEAVEEFHPPTSGVTSSNSSESEKRQSNGPTSSPRLARSTLVCSDSTNADRYTIPTSQGEGTTVSAFRPGSSPPAVAVSQPDCMADIGSAFRAAGFPEEVTNVLLTSWSQSTKKRYQGPWRARSIWCSSRGLCPFSAPVTDVLTFLTETVTNKSLEYRTLAVYKSAISQGHLPVGQTKLGDLPVVSQFMKGIFRMKPPTPRLSSTWDVKHLLDFLATLDPPAGLTLKMLSLKLAALLALTSSACAHELIKLDLDFVSIKGDSWEFSLAEHTKVSRPGHPARKIYLPAFPDNPKICVVKTLQEYRSRTENRRQSSRLLISFVRPFKPISSQTMSRWLRKTMQLAGIACHFTGHSTRSASTSAAARAGVPLDTILVAADWSSSESFKRFFLRSPDKGEFARAVLTGVPE